MRQFKILSLLNENEIFSASRLSEIFEVSRRTILRDMDELLSHGYPIEVVYGKNGGYKFEEGYKFQIEALTDKQREVLGQLVSHLNFHPEDYDLQDIFPGKSYINYDLSGWHQENQNLFEEIEDAILNKQPFNFVYYDSKGYKTSRNVYPLQLVFKDRFWYMKAMDGAIEKLFKLRRIEAISPPVNKMENMIKCVMDVKTEAIFKILDECIVDQIENLNQMWSKVSFWAVDTKWVYDFILSFGDKAVVLSPENVVERIKKEIDRMATIYQK